MTNLQNQDIYLAQNAYTPRVQQTNLPTNSTTVATPRPSVSNNSARANSGDALSFLLVAILVLIGASFWFASFWRKKIYAQINEKRWDKMVFLEFQMPKETIEQINKDSMKKDEKSFLEVGEAVFGIVSEFGKGWWEEWFFEVPTFSFEIVASDKKIKFWIVCHEDQAPIIRRQVIAIYSKANVNQLTKFDVIKPDSVLFAQELDLARRFELPFNTYKMLENDPLNAITNAMGGLESYESLALQMVLTPVKDDWHQKSKTLAQKIQQGQNPKEVLEGSKNQFGKFFGGTFKYAWQIFFPKGKDAVDQNEKKEREIDLTGKYQQMSLTPLQQEIVKKLDEKAAKPGFKFALRVVASSKTKERSKEIVDQFVPALQIYENKTFNGFKKAKTNVDECIKNYIMRSPNLKQKNILSSEETHSLWHLPNYMINSSGIDWLASRKPPIPIELPDKNDKSVMLGWAQARGESREVHMLEDDRFRHIYSLGGSGSGKSVLMAHVIMQDIEMGNGVCVVDPHGTLVDEILWRMPEHRKEDVIVFNPAYIDRPLALNMLETDPKKPTDKTLVIDILFGIWDKLYDLKKTGGPMFESYMKNSMRLVMAHAESGCTLMEISKVLSDEDFRAYKLAMCEEQDIVDFWEKEATKAEGEASLANMVPYITSKLAPFVSNDFLKPMIAQQKSSVQFREAMDNKKIILVSLSKGLIGEQSAYLIGMVMIGGLLMAGMGRSDNLKHLGKGETETLPYYEQAPFFIYIDEMQNFLFDAIPKALEEIRKYRIGFYLAHQFVKQVIVDGSERIKDSLMANCASKFIYRCGAEDAEILEKEFKPTLMAADLIMPERFTVNTILLINGQKTQGFNLKVPAPSKITDEMKASREMLIEMTKQKYGRPKAEIMEELKNRHKLMF